LSTHHRDEKDVAVSAIAGFGLSCGGLPLVVEFGKHVRTIGFDIALQKVLACQRGADPSRELSDAQVRAGTFAFYTEEPQRPGEVDVIVVAVPAPEDDVGEPDLRPC
jgi:UDP-N-acetyl-D-glucosamine/UDP-N-acetyl-D-galactosamine dehydrogenase